MTSEARNPWVGQSIKRKEDERLLKGEGQYLVDLTAPRMAYLGFIRSPHASAVINAIDTSAAEQLPGVHAVITGEEFSTSRPVLADNSIPNLPGDVTKRPDYWPLAIGDVKYAGDLVAAVIARDKYVVEDAMELVEVDYALRTPVLDAEEALKPDAPLVYPEWGDNIIYHQHVTSGDVEKGFADADLIVSERIPCHRTGGQAMEMRGCLAKYDANEGLVLWLTTQRPHIIRNLIAEYFELPYDKTRVIQPKDMGGAFGTKAPLYREEIVASHLAMKLRRPIKWVENRVESLTNLGQERDQIHYVEIALKRDGTILAIRDKIIANVGDARTAIYVGFAMPFIGALYVTNANEVVAADVELTCVVTNKACITPVRAFGSYAGRVAVDRVLNIAARKLELDALEMRRKHCIKTFPYETPLGVHVDSGDFIGSLDIAAEKIGYEAFREKQLEAWDQGRYLGIGIAMGIELSGMRSEVLVRMEHMPGFGSASVRFDAHGKVQVSEGDSPHGQGHETTFAQAVAGELGLTPDDVYVTYGDTMSTPYSCGTLGSRGASYTVSAAIMAARALKPKMSQIAAHMLEIADGTADRESFNFIDGEAVWIADNSKRVSIKRIAHAAIQAPIHLPPGMEAGLDHTSYFEAPATGMHSCNVHTCTVEVFPKTGQFKILRYIVVDDAGAPINPMLVRGQINGGVVMGIGNATMEEYIYDADGHQLTTTLRDYSMPSARDLPYVEVVHHDSPSPYTPLGSKGKGEGVPGTCSSCLINAIENALMPFDVQVTSLPLRPENIWQMVQAKRS